MGGPYVGGPGDPAGPHAPFPPAGWQTPQTSTNAIAAVALAAVSYAIPLVPALVALYLARSAEEEIAVSSGRVTGSGLVGVARALAWVNVVVSVLGLLFALALLGLVGSLL